MGLWAFDFFRDILGPPNVRPRPLTIAVDLTALAPGGSNGGFGRFVLDLLRSLAGQAPQHRYVYLTAWRTHDALALLEGLGAERLCVVEEPTASAVGGGALVRLAPLLPPALCRVAHRGRQALRRLSARRAGSALPSKQRLGPLGVDVLFCPFTASTYAEPGVPMVSIVHDLSHVAYPQFFHAVERAERSAQVHGLGLWADRLVCTSDYLRQALVRDLGIPTLRARAIRACAHSTLPRLSPEGALSRLGVDRRPYLLYPASFWPHQNHQMLLVAFALLRARRPDLDVDLVFAGPLEGPARERADEARQMGLEGRVRFLGGLPEPDEAALFEGCRLVVFPSLYEGSGVPLLEALRHQKPVLCSTGTSLPEVVGDAGLFFDPRKPEEIARTMERALDDPGLGRELVRRGRQQLESLSFEGMAREYLDVFEEAAAEPRTARQILTGLHPDGWTDACLRLVHGPARVARTLELDLLVPPWVPGRQVDLRLKSRPPNGGGAWSLARGSRSIVRVAIPPGAGELSLQMSPAFRLRDVGLGPDDRLLGCVCRAARILSADRRPRELPRAGLPAAS